MAKFVYIYTGGSRPESEEEGKKVMQQWMDWLGRMGDHVTDVGNPLGASKSVNGGATLNASGYSIVDAGSLDQATTHAKGCPVPERRGNLEGYAAIAKY